MNDQERRAKVRKLLDDMGMGAAFDERPAADRIAALHISLCNVPGVEIASDRADLRLVAEMLLHTTNELTLSAVQHLHTAHSGFRKPATTGVMMLELGKALHNIGSLLMEAGAQRLSEATIDAVREKLEKGDSSAVKDLMNAITDMVSGMERDVNESRR